jgi:hypothetical protein
MVKKIINMRKMTFWCLIWVLSIIGVFYATYILHNRWTTILLPFTFIFPAIGSVRQWNHDFKRGTFTMKKLMLNELKNR